MSNKLINLSFFIVELWEKDAGCREATYFNLPSDVES